MWIELYYIKMKQFLICVSIILLFVHFTNGNEDGNVLSLFLNILCNYNNSF